MKNYLILFVIICFASLKAHAQIGSNSTIPDHTPMMNSTWEAIDKMSYKISYSGSKKIYTPFYPKELKALENKVVELPGYLIPLHSGRTHKNFMISVLPVSQCQFCGANGIPAMVEVTLAGSPIKYSDNPIKVKGKLVFTKEPLQGNSEIKLINATLIK